MCNVQVEIAKRIGYTVEAGGRGIFYVQNVSSPDGEVHQVNLHGPKPGCQCTHWQKHNQPCRHMAVTFFKEHMLGPNARTAQATRERYWPKWASAELYLHLYQNRCVKRPKIYAGPFKGHADDLLGPPVQDHKRPGRPKKKRMQGKRRANNPRQVAEQLPNVINAEYADVMQFL